MSSLDAQFTQAQAASKSVTDMSNDEKLKVYALFKQATTGACNVKSPGGFDLVGKAKWSAWNKLGQMTQDDAKKQYIEFIKSKTNTQQNNTTTNPQEGPSYKSITTKLENGVFTITMNRPKVLNSFDAHMYNEIVEALELAKTDKRVVLVVLTGAGKFYSAGNDLANFSQADINDPKSVAALADRSKAIMIRFVNAFIHFPKILVAAVNGPSIGIAVTTLALCDFVYSSESATFHTPFTQLAQTPEGCSTLMFREIMGVHLANEVLILGKKLSSQQAKNCGLVNEVFQEAEFRSKVEEIAKTIAALPREAVLNSKKLLRNPQRIALLEATNKHEGDVLAERWLSKECAQAVMNFFMRKRSKL